MVFYVSLHWDLLIELLRKTFSSNISAKVLSKD